MKIKFAILLGVLFIILSIQTQAKAHQAFAEIQNSKGEKIGKAIFNQTKDGIDVQVTASSLTPGKHGIHIHEVGKCDPPDFKSAGGHFNPSHKHHGLQNPQGAHGGDLPNLIVKPNGTGKIKFLLKDATLREGSAFSHSLFHPNGTSLVIHAKEDDEKTDPSGNSGDRIACGVIR